MTDKQNKPGLVLTALGLMSGTSADGIDAAIIRTDGEKIESCVASLMTPYSKDMQTALKAAFHRAASLDPQGNPHEMFMDLDEQIADWHGDVVHKLLEHAGLTHRDVDVIGFHGQTILHRPDIRITWQIGDAQQLADLAGIDVVADFRKADVAAGGQGAPFVPLYHVGLVKAARDAGLLPADQAVGILNLGGVGNVTWIGGGAQPQVLAFDTGPANALIDDWLSGKIGKSFDAGGAIAARGRPHADILKRLMANPYLDKKPPKSLDRNDFISNEWAHLSVEDGAATLTEFTALTVAAAVRHLAERPAIWVVCGGGRLNPSIMQALERNLGVPVKAAEAMGWRGDFLEAEAFGFLAVRSLKGLPLSLPSTTGVPRPMPGGKLFKSARP